MLEIVANFSSAAALINTSPFENLVTLSYHDPLTGTYNRTNLKELLKKWEKPPLLMPKRKSASSLLGLNNFKAVSDNYRHRAGDQLLKKPPDSSFPQSEKKGSIFFELEATNSFYLAFHDDASSIKEAKKVCLKSLNPFRENWNLKWGVFPSDTNGPYKKHKNANLQNQRSQVYRQAMSESIY